MSGYPTATPSSTGGSANPLPALVSYDDGSTIAITDQRVSPNNSVAPISITLPDASLLPVGWWIEFDLTQGNQVVTVYGNGAGGGQTVNGSSTYLLRYIAMTARFVVLGPTAWFANYSLQSQGPPGNDTVSTLSVQNGAITSAKLAVGAAAANITSLSGGVLTAASVSAGVLGTSAAIGNIVSGTLPGSSLTKFETSGTGNNAAQNYAHSLGSDPWLVSVTMTNVIAAGSLTYTHDATNVTVTASTGVAYKIVAIK